MCSLLFLADQIALHCSRTLIEAAVIPEVTWFEIPAQLTIDTPQKIQIEMGSDIS